MHNWAQNPNETNTKYIVYSLKTKKETLVGMNLQGFRRQGDCYKDVYKNLFFMSIKIHNPELPFLRCNFLTGAAILPNILCNPTDALLNKSIP